MTDDKPPYESIPLERPRSLNERELELVQWLLRAPAATDELRDQAERATVSEVCSCGCPSVTFAIPDDVPVAQLDAAHPDVRHGEDLSIEAEATSPDGRELNVILHILGGRLFELEVWAGMYGGDPVTELPDVSRMRFT